MVGSYLRRRKPTAYDRACLSKGKILVKNVETGTIYCKNAPRYSKKLENKAKKLLEESTVERLKSFLALKGFVGYSKLKKSQLINLILTYTDWNTGEVIYRTKLRDEDEVKFSLRKRSKSSRRGRSKSRK